MAAYRRVYNSRESRHLQADYQEPGSASEAFGNGLPLPFYLLHLIEKNVGIFTIIVLPINNKEKQKEHTEKHENQFHQLVCNE